MPIDPVPWFIGGGAQHSPEVARLLAHVASAGREGPIGPGDCQVRPTAVPSGSVRVMPGALVIPNRAPASGQQSYLARVSGDTQVALTATTSAGPRTDLVYVQVSDPQYPGVAAPPSVPEGPYVAVKVLEGVDPATVALSQVLPNVTGIALARVTRPASTGVVQAEHVTLLLSLAAPRMMPLTRVWNQPDGNASQGMAAAAFTDWLTSWQVQIPAWAVYAQVQTIIGGMVLTETGSTGGDWSGEIRTVLADVATEATELNTSVPAGNGKRDALSTVVAGTLTLPAAVRGTTVTLKTQARKLASAGATLGTGPGTVVSHTVQFYEAVDPAYWG